MNMDMPYLKSYLIDSSKHEPASSEAAYVMPM